MLCVDRISTGSFLLDVLVRIRERTENSAGLGARRRRFEMADTIEIVKIQDPKHAKDLGQLSPAKDATAPLLLVFGGIVVDGRRSGLYMWDFMDDIEEKFHIFVAFDQNVNGEDAYKGVMKALKEHDLTASDKILYLFSGGWRPGIDVLRSEGPKLFSSIFLVDIWMGDRSDSPDFYKALADKVKDRLTYIFTPNGAVNGDARDYIANRLGSQRAIRVDYQKGVDHMKTHMSTNKVAVAMLK
jgi:hypothetical protein